eukprot:3933390-Rhodomonas_salina.1
MEYRSPEAVLMAGWSFPADVWALGCSLFEVIAGRKLFEVEHEITQLYMLEKILECKIPQDMLHCGARNRNSFNNNLISLNTCALAQPHRGKASKISSARPLSEYVHDALLTSLLQEMLTVDPKQRPTAKSLLRH